MWLADPNHRDFFSTALPCYSNICLRHWLQVKSQIKMKSFTYQLCLCSQQWFEFNVKISIRSQLPKNNSPLSLNWKAKFGQWCLTVGTTLNLGKSQQFFKWAICLYSSIPISLFDPSFTELYIQWMSPSCYTEIGFTVRFNLEGFNLLK